MEHLPHRITHIVALLACLQLGCTLDAEDDAIGDDDVSDDDLSDDDTDLPSDDDTAHDLMELQVAYAWDELHSCEYIRGGRVVDVHGDGVVDADDPMQMWVLANPYNSDEYLALIGHDGTSISELPIDAGGITGTIGDIDAARTGMEFLTFLVDHDVDETYMSLVDEHGVVWNRPFTRTGSLRPWLTDLEGDGQLELLVGKDIYNAHGGVLTGVLQGFGNNDSTIAVAADLDLDGKREIISMKMDDPQKVYLHDRSGAIEETCWTGHWDSALPAWAIGDLDGDPEGEFVFATQGWVVACDSDGSQIAAIQHNMSYVQMAGLGQLDSDPLPEIVIGGNAGIIALDTDLSPLWIFDGNEKIPNYNHNGFALADFDGDGRHEIVFTSWGTLVILDDDGQVLTFLEASATCSSPYNAPAVFDADGDGLAEIVVLGLPGLLIIENPYGGWLVPGADEPWPGIDKHPGDRTLTGGIPDPLDVHWAEPWTNVWQGLPAWP